MHIIQRSRLVLTVSHMAKNKKVTIPEKGHTTMYIHQDIEKNHFLILGLAGKIK